VITPPFSDTPSKAAGLVSEAISCRTSYKTIALFIYIKRLFGITAKRIMTTRKEWESKGKAFHWDIFVLSRVWSLGYET
jgi:hypothetical protein